MSQSVTVSWSWQDVGQVMLCEGRLVFPPVPNVSGVYRFTFHNAAGMRARVYVGEAALLQDRFRGYRTPRPSQRTNLRMNPIVIDTLKRGGYVGVEIATEACVQTGGDEPSLLDLTWKSSRVLVERAAEVIERRGDVPVLNR